MAGYSDPINHAFAFAAKHHDQQVRKGTRYPYLTAAPNLAVILARYDQDDSTLVAGILHNVVEDCVRDGYTTEMFHRRIGDKFGEPVLSTVLAVIERRYDDEGIELSHLERKEDLFERLAHAGAQARWIAAADQLQSGGTLLADLRRTDFPEAVWSRFTCRPRSDDQLVPARARAARRARIRLSDNGGAARDRALTRALRRRCARSG